MAAQLLRPGPLDQPLQSGLFLSGIRRTGKTTFLRHDLIPALEALGAVVLYVDLWAEPSTSPLELVRREVIKTLEALASPGSQIVRRLAGLRSLELGAGGFKFGLPGGATLAEALAAMVEQAGTSVVLIVDEVQHALASEAGPHLLTALKSARDQINPVPAMPGKFILLGTGSHRSQVAEMVARRNQAFAGAVQVDYPLLGPDYVAFVLDWLRASRVSVVPSQDAAFHAFVELGHRPEEFVKALAKLNRLDATLIAGEPDRALLVIANTLRASAADLELAKLDEMGAVAKAVFDRVVSRPGKVSLYSAEAIQEYCAAVGREVRVEEVQPATNQLVAANILMRRAHGDYEVTDPFVAECWRQNRALVAGGIADPNGVGP
jgi:hypothetical protein